MGIDMRKYAGGSFLKVDDVRDGPLRKTIAKVQIGNYDRPELHFTDGSILSLNAGNTRLMNKCYGVDSDGWISREIELRLGHVQFQGSPTESVIVVPISAPLTAAELKAAQDTAAASPDMDDSIPFN